MRCKALDDVGGGPALAAVLLWGRLLRGWLRLQRTHPQHRDTRQHHHDNGDAAAPATRPAHKPAAFFTNRSSNVLARSSLAFLSSSSNATSMSLADCMPAAGMTPVTE